jgi:hypothetical protein
MLNEKCSMEGGGGQFIANKLSTPHGPVAPMQVISCGVAPASSSAKQRLDYLPTGLGEDML